MKVIFKISVLLAAATFFGFLFFYFNYAKNQSKICFDSRCFFVEIAKTNAQREQGLMFRKSLEEDKGMFFIFDKEGIYSFWMKNTLIPIDIIWLDKNYDIVFISKNSRPCGNDNCLVINPNINARYVLEINAGISEKIGLKIGDKAGVDN